MLKCPVCKINPANISGRVYGPCPVCRKAMDQAAGKKWVRVGNFQMPLIVAKKAGLLEKDKKDGQS